MVGDVNVLCFALVAWVVGEGYSPSVVTKEVDWAGMVLEAEEGKDRTSTNPSEYCGLAKAAREAKYLNSVVTNVFRRKHQEIGQPAK